MVPKTKFCMISSALPSSGPVDPRRRERHAAVRMATRRRRMPTDRQPADIPIPRSRSHRSFRLLRSSVGRLVLEGGRLPAAAPLLCQSASTHAYRDGFGCLEIRIIRIVSAKNAYMDIRIRIRF
jgi:hypothetical protein